MPLTVLSKSIRDRMDTPQRPGWRLLLSRRMAVTDAMVLAVTMGISIVAKFGREVEAVAQGPFGVNYPAFAAFIALAWLGALALFDTRDPHIIGDGDLEYRRVVRATTLMFGALAIASVLFK